MNPATAFAQGVGGVAQAAFAGGVGAAVTAATGGAAAPAVIAAGAGVLAAGSESAVRGGGSAQTTNNAVRGVAGLYAGRSTATNRCGGSDSRRTRSPSRGLEAFTTVFRTRSAQAPEQWIEQQPHNEDPNRLQSTSTQMLTPNRRNTEAAEKTARAELRIAASKGATGPPRGRFPRRCGHGRGTRRRPPGPAPRFPAKNQPPRK